MPISTITLTNLLSLVKNSLPAWIFITDARLQEIISLAISDIHSLYVNNNKEFYNPTVEIDFYNASQNDFINIRDLTRWVGISPSGFKAVKLLSCNLKEVSPDTVELPPGVAYIQDIRITIGNSSDANVEVPEANTGLCCLRDTSGLLNVLTLGDTNSWVNVATITALLTYYRPVVLPDWGDPSSFMDAPEKDIGLLVNYCKRYILGTSTSFDIKEQIENIESELIYEGKI